MPVDFVERNRHEGELEDSRESSMVGSILGQHCRRCANIEMTYGERLLFAGERFR